MKNIMDYIALIMLAFMAFSFWTLHLQCNEKYGRTSFHALFFAVLTFLSALACFLCGMNMLITGPSTALSCPECGSHVTTPYCGHCGTEIP